jgi:hypothetical protein
VVGMEQWAEIRRLFFVKRLSIKEIVRRTGLARGGRGTPWAHRWCQVWTVSPSCAGDISAVVLAEFPLASRNRSRPTRRLLELPSSHFTSTCSWSA